MTKNFSPARHATQLPAPQNLAHRYDGEKKTHRHQATSASTPHGNSEKLKCVSAESACQLFDLAADPSQKVDVSKQHPEIIARLKRQMLEINASVMAEAPDWGSADEAPTPSSPNPGTSKNPESTKVKEK
jgi:hypothetical protein